MRVVSWNVNGIRASVRHGFVDFVDRSGADIVSVQEVRARPEVITPTARRQPGWHTAFTVAERRGYTATVSGPGPAVARAGSDDHVGEAARQAPVEAGVRAPSSGPGGECVLPIQIHHRRWPSRPEPSRAGE